MKKRRPKLHPTVGELTKRQRLFETVYPEGSGAYGAQIEARNYPHAYDLAERRGLGELVVDQARWRDQQTQGIANLLLHPKRTRRHLVDALHEACFLCYVGMASGTITAREAMADDGLVHSIAHIIAGVPERDRDMRVARMAREFEGRVPGWPRPPRMTGLVTEAP